MLRRAAITCVTPFRSLGVCIVRPHRCMYRCIAWSVTACVFLGHDCELCKQLNLSRCPPVGCWRVDSDGPMEPCIRWDPDRPRERVGLLLVDILGLGMVSVDIDISYTQWVLSAKDKVSNWPNVIRV